MIEITKADVAHLNLKEINEVDKGMIEKYAFYRYIGIIPSKAAYLADMHVEFILKAESSPLYRTELARLIASMDVNKTWNLKKSVWNLVCMIEDPFVKDQFRIAAIKELNMLAGITFTDDKGNTKARGLDDFYKGVVEGANGKAENTL